MLCRAVDAPLINLGFSGSAKGEIKVAELIGSLDLAAFVMDYDYNAPNFEHLKKTHEPFFKAVRKARPDLPIIILGKITHATPERDAVVRATLRKRRQGGRQKSLVCRRKNAF